MLESIAIVAVASIVAESVYTAKQIANEADRYPTCPPDADPAEWREFIDGIPPFELETETELDAMASEHGE